MNKPTIVVFDLFDTLVHSNYYEFDRGIDYLVSEILKEGVSKEEVYHHVDLNYTKKQYEGYLLNKEINLKDEIALLKDTFGFRKEIELDEVAYLLISKMNETVLFNDTISTLKTLKENGAKLYILSNTIFDAITMRKFLAQFDLLPYFEKVFFSASYGVRKPGIEFFSLLDEVIDKYGIKNKKEIFFIGDNAVADAEGATNYGLTPIWIKRRDEICSLPCYQVNSLQEILTYILK